MIKIIHSPTISEPYFVIDKSALLPTCALNDSDQKDNAMKQLLNIIEKSSDPKTQFTAASIRNIKENGLLHRLDTATRGLLLVAATSEFYEYMTREQNRNRFIKSYIALCDDTRGEGGESNWEERTITTRFRSFGVGGAMSIPVTEGASRAARKKCKSDKCYTTKISIIARVKSGNVTIDSGKKYQGGSDRVIVRATITQGARHQVRSHLSFLGLPVVADALYNKNVAGEAMQFFASTISFTLPNGARRVYSIESEILKTFLAR